MDEEAIEQQVPPALGRALQQSKEVREKALAVAADLGTANALVRERIDRGATTVSAHHALAAGAHAEGKVHECADDLDAVSGCLSIGIEDLKQVNIALAGARRVLTRTNQALAAAREDEKSARLRALHDSTTGLPNRELFDDRLDHAISLAKRNDWMLAVMFLDLDSFKLINDTHGHDAGDRVLTETASRLLEHCRHEDSVCRNGGDEFLYLLVNPQNVNNVARIARDLSKSISRPIDAGGFEIVVRPSIGIATYPNDAVHGDDLVRSADAAMYHAKRGSKGYAFVDSFPMTASLF